MNPSQPEPEWLQGPVSRRPFVGLSQPPVVPKQHRLMPRQCTCGSRRATALWLAFAFAFLAVLLCVVFLPEIRACLATTNSIVSSDPAAQVKGLLVGGICLISLLGAIKIIVSSQLHSNRRIQTPRHSSGMDLPTTENEGN